jgi:tRNA(adenine34) deaminase
MENIKKYMKQAYHLALKAKTLDEVPVGCLIISPNGTIIAEAHNSTEFQKNPIAHAEVIAIHKACHTLNQKRLYDCTLITTLEPCPMCADLISKARIKNIYIGAYDPKGGGIFQGPKLYDHATCYHKPAVYFEANLPECGQILSDFFQSKRKQR